MLCCAGQAQREGHERGHEKTPVIIDDLWRRLAAGNAGVQSGCLTVYDW